MHLRSVAVMTALAMASLLPVALRGDTYPRPAGFTAIHYDFAVTLTDANDQIVVTDTVTVRATADGVSQIALDLCQLRTAPEKPDHSNPCLVRTPYGLRGAAPAASNASVGRGMSVTSVTGPAGVALRFEQSHDRLIVTLPQPLRTGEEYSFTAGYHGQPANGLLIGENKYHDREFFTNAWPDLSRNWLAVVDHPSDKATKSITVTAPDHYQVISNGLKTEETDLGNGLRRTTWREDAPICTWQFSLGAAPMAVDYFGRFHGIGLSAWVYPQEREAGFKAFSEYTQPILEFYIDHIGPYSYEKLAQVEANGTGGGMELASDIYYGYGGDAPQRQLLAHEMAHQWFGDSVTENDWDNVWLSEGFATYFALLYTEHQDGRDAFVQGVEQSAAQARRYAEAHPDSTVVHNNLSDISQVIANNAQIYQEGAQVLQMLRGVLGTDTFWDGIRRYYQRYRNANASSVDFQHAMEQACAADASDCPAYGRDLSWFFNEWLHRGGDMHVAASWRYDAAAKQLDLTFDQTGQPYQMPIQIGITEPAPPPPPAAEAGRGGRGRGGRGRGGRGGRSEAGPAAPPVVMLNAAHNTFSLPLAQAPVRVTLDPNHWVTMANLSLNPQ